MREKAISNFNEISTVVVDLDGTLLTKEGMVSLRTKTALGQWLDQGQHVIFATGRPYPYAKALAQSIDSRIDLISFNGGYVDIENSELANHPLEEKALMEIAQYIQKFDGEIYFKQLDRIYAYGPRNSIFIYPEPMMKTTFLDEKEEFLHLTKKKILKILFFSPIEEQVISLRKTIKALGNYTMTNYKNMGFEICPASRDKGVALREVMAYYKLERSNVMAIGDGENDLRLFEEAGCLVAMENGDQRLKETADWITKSNEEDGVAIVLEDMIKERQRK